jgi:hypothetical protein
MIFLKITDMDDIDNAYWARVFKREAEQYAGIGKAILANRERVKVGSNTIKLVRKHATR